VLSRDFLQELEGYSVPADEPRPAHPLTCDPEGTWFCMDCGMEMSRRPGFVDCPSCGKGLNGFVNALIKSNPHP
jgi:rubrerythrin